MHRLCFRTLITLVVSVSLLGCPGEPDSPTSTPDGPDVTSPSGACVTDADCLGVLTSGICQRIACLDGVCEAVASDDGTSCDDGDICTIGDTCANGSCSGLVLECNDDDPCTDDACGMDGECAYTPIEGCCVAQCGDSVCGDDGCGGTCGQCEGCDGPDPALCVEGQCQEVCCPSCADVEYPCGGDGCGGSCGECGEGELCDGVGQCQCAPQCDGLQCGDDQCGGSCGDCAGANDICDAGQCVCVPSCEPGPNVCGDDGCGGSCGDCADDEFCNSDSQCQCAPQCDDLDCGGDQCGGTCGDCGPGTLCSEAQLCEEVIQTSCGEAVTCADACDEPWSEACVAECAADAPAEALSLIAAVAECINLFCGGGTTADDCVVISCEFELEPCQAQCLTMCVNTECGDDGCGSSCGTCTEPGTECEAGLCVVPCTADCAGKACGDDGCGGSCGDCVVGGLCDAGACVDAGPETGETCADPFTIDDLPFAHSGDTTFASADYGYASSACPGEEGGWGEGSNDHAFFFAAPALGVYTVTLTPDLTFDSNLYAITDCGNVNGSCVAGNEIAGGGAVEQIVIEASEGELFYIIVDGYGTTSNVSGAYTLAVSEPCIPSCEGKTCGPNGCGGTCGVCMTGFGCTPEGECVPAESVPGNTCAIPFVLEAAGASVEGDTSDATPTYGVNTGQCDGIDWEVGQASNDEVWSFTSPMDAVYTFALQAEFASSLYVASDCADPATACLGGDDAYAIPSDQSVLVSMAADETVYVVVDGYDAFTNYAGPYTLSVSEPCIPSCVDKTCGSDGCGSSCGTCPAGEGCTLEGGCVPLAELPGNTCDAPFIISEAPFMYVGDTAGASNSFSTLTGECPGIGSLGAASNDHVFAFTSPIDGVYTATLDATFDSTLYVSLGCDDLGESCFGGQDLVGTPENVLFGLNAGQTAYIFVDGYSSFSDLSGPYTVSLSEACIPACEGKDCGSDSCGFSCGDCKPGDICDGEGICQDGATIAGNTCGNAFPLDAPPVVVSGDTSDNSAGYAFGPGACPGVSSGYGEVGKDEVWSLAATEAVVYTITLESEWDAVLYAARNCDAIDDTCYAANDGFGSDTISISLDAEETAYIFVDGYSEGAGPYTLSVGDPCYPLCGGKECGDDGCGNVCGECALGSMCDESQMCVSGDTLDGNACGNPFELGAGSTVNGNTSDAWPLYGIESGECPGGGSLGWASKDEVWALTAAETGYYTFTLDAAFDSVLYVSTDCVDIGAGCFGAQDLVGTPEVITAFLEAGTTAFVFVDGYSSFSDLNGLYTLSASEPCLPDCDGKNCGSDGCGGDCGVCDEGDICGDAGVCELCVPDCTGMICGADGCGGECGICSAGLSCVAGECVDQGQCGGACGGMGNDGTCWCDTACFGLGDCCADVCDFCSDEYPVECGG